MTTPQYKKQLHPHLLLRSECGLLGEPGVIRQLEHATEMG